MKSIHLKVKRAKSSLITQMRIEKIGLKAFLYSRWVPEVEDETCECGAAKQTARHILQECRIYSRKRRTLWPVGQDTSEIIIKDGDNTQRDAGESALYLHDGGFHEEHWAYWAISSP